MAASHRFNVKSVAIIGAGPSGIAAAKYILAEKAFQKIDVFEQRARVGGIWDYHNEPKESVGVLPTPQLSPHTGLAKPIWDRNGTKQDLGSGAAKPAAPRFLSPLYDRLETNIPRTLMGFSDINWPQDAQLFPKHETVTEYLERYAEDVKHLITFQTQVVSITPEEAGADQERWVVETQDIESPDGAGQTTKNVYDAVIVASGHFSVPFIPDVKGMKEWSQKYPGAISHAMYYKRPEDYENKKVVVIGNGPSGIDIAMQIMTTCKLPLIQSTLSESYLITDSSSSKVDKPGVIEYIIQDRALRFSDGSVEKDVDAIVYCTGYLYSFPFLQSLQPPLIGDGTHVQNLYQHLIYRDHPTMAFPVLQQRVIPFPMAEVQSAVIARLWSGRLSLPSADEMKAWEDKTYEETGGGRNFHILSFPKDANYINAMHDWAMTASGGDSAGKKPPRWSEKEYWIREQFPAIKKAFQDRGDERHKVKTMEELGFDFEKYKMLYQL